MMITMRVGKKKQKVDRIFCTRTTYYVLSYIQDRAHHFTIIIIWTFELRAARSSGNSAIKHIYIIITCYRYLHVGGRVNFGCGDRAGNDLYVIILVSYYIMYNIDIAAGTAANMLYESQSFMYTFTLAQVLLYAL